MKRERATYDPDLPHDWLAEQAGAMGVAECAICGGFRGDDLHQMPLLPQRAEEPLLVTEKGS